MISEKRSPTEPWIDIVTATSLWTSPNRNAVLLQADAHSLPLADNTVRLIVSSPNYNVGWPYLDCDDDRPLEEFLTAQAAILRECYRVLTPGGTLAWNVPPSTRRPDERAFPFGAWVQLHLRETGWLLAEPIAWVKAGKDGQPLAHSTAFGAPSNPYLRPTYELVVLARKQTYRRETRQPWATGFLEMTKDVWTIPSARPPKRSLGEPPAFPSELVRRLVLLFSDPGDVVLDPMSGSGTTVTVAVAAGRIGIGSDLSTAYLVRAAERIARVPSRLRSRQRCATCNEWFVVGRQPRVSCSPACKQKRYRQRLKEDVLRASATSH